MTDDKNKTDRVNVTKDGDQYKATVTRYFASQDEAANWGDTVTTRDTPEKAASEMTPEEAEEINSNVNPAPVPVGANANLSGAGADTNDASNEPGSGNREAPHPTKETANSK